MCSWRRFRRQMQRGIGSVLILIVLAAVIGASAIVYGYFVVSKNAVPNQAKKQTVELPPENLIPPPETPVGTPECPDTDYTGCDNSSLWMTWDGENAQTSRVSQEGIIYSK